VLSREFGYLFIPNQSGSNAFYLVGSHLLTISRSAKNYSKSGDFCLQVALHSKGGINTKRWVVIKWVEGLWSVIKDFMAEDSQLLN
jgi:hypothetical protein